MWLSLEKMAAHKKPHRRANRRHHGQGPMDQRNESFLADALALAGEEPDAAPDLT
jgi:hypothetical protein